MGAFCRWHNKSMEDVAEWQQEQCLKNGRDCTECEDLISEKEKDNE